MSEMGVLEAISRTSRAVDECKHQILEEARKFSFKVSPETTPDTISNYRQVIGTKEHFKNIEEAVENLNEKYYLEELSRSTEEHFYDIATFIEIYQYLYLMNGKTSPGNTYQSENESIRVGEHKVLTSVSENLGNWHDVDREENIDYAGIHVPNRNLLCMPYFPEEYIEYVESEIEKKLKSGSQDIDAQLLKALKKFPEEFNKKTGINYYDKLDFFYTYTHEFSHAYVSEETKKKDRGFNEATAQFISKYLESGNFDENGNIQNSYPEAVKFDNSPEDYSGYDDEYYEGASEDIFVIVEIIQMKCLEKIRDMGGRRMRRFSLIDWAIKEEIKAIKKGSGRSIQTVIANYLPVEIQDEVKVTNKLIEQEINPLIEDVDGFIDEFIRFENDYRRASDRTQKIMDLQHKAHKENLDEDNFQKLVKERKAQKTKLDEVRKILKNDLRNLDKISKKDHIDPDKVFNVVRQLPDDIDPSKGLEQIKKKLRPGKEELNELADEIKDLESVKKKVVEVREMDKKDLSSITWSDGQYEEPVRELKKEELKDLNNLIDRLDELEEECRSLREDVENIAEAY